VRIQGDLKQAREFLLKSLELMDLVRDLGELSRTKYDIALLEEMEGNYSKALEFAQGALEINERLGRELRRYRN
jgi:tetratricopeptide (TPR) repeat protein